MKPPKGVRFPLSMPGRYITYALHPDRVNASARPGWSRFIATRTPAATRSAVAISSSPPMPARGSAHAIGESVAMTGGGRP